jgi:hypothetical protein
LCFVVLFRRYQTDWSKVGLRSLHELGRDGLYGEEFFAGKGSHKVPEGAALASRAALAAFKAEPRASFIPWHTVFKPASMRCFLDPTPPGSAPGTEAEARACHFWVASFGAAAANLDAVRLRAPRDGREAPWGRERVMMFMLGHWDSAAQRDTRGLLHEELPSFLASVRRVREDPHTAGMRIVLDFPGPISPGRSTGWRNEFALAASAAYIRREVAAEGRRPGADLGVELLEPSFLAATMTRRSGQTSDETHFMKHSAFGKRYTGPRPAGLERTDPRTGDGRFCSGNVGEAFARLLLDFICDNEQAEAHQRGFHSLGGGALSPRLGGHHHDHAGGSHGGGGGGNHGSGGGLLGGGGVLGGGVRHHHSHHAEPQMLA